MPDSPIAAATLDSSLTDYVAGFVVATRGQDIPTEVTHLGKRSVLDGIGLALAGAASQTGNITRRYLAALGVATEGGSAVIGSTVIGSDYASFPPASPRSPTGFPSTPTTSTTLSSPLPRIASTACSRIRRRRRCRLRWRSPRGITKAVAT